MRVDDGQAKREDEQRRMAEGGAAKEAQERKAEAEQGPTFGQKVRAAIGIPLVGAASMAMADAGELNLSKDTVYQNSGRPPIEEAAENYIDLEQEAKERREQSEERSKVGPEATQISEKVDPAFEKMLADARAQVDQFYARQKERDSQENDHSR